MKGARGIAWLTTVLIAALGPGCSSACRIQGTGTVQLLEMEGGFFGIVTDAGDKFRPVDLPEPFARPGMRVRFCAEPVEGLASIHMWGVPVTILEIAAETPPGPGPAVPDGSGTRP